MKDQGSTDNELPEEGEGSADQKRKVSSGDIGKEVSAATIGRMLGLATSSELKLIDGKLDLITAKLANLTVRLEKALSSAANAPTGSDLERIDVQIGSLRNLMVELLSGKTPASMTTYKYQGPAARPPAKPEAESERPSPPASDENANKS